MKVYLVEDCWNSPGKIMGVFREKESAEQLAEVLTEEITGNPKDGAYQVEERTLIYGQAPVKGYNK